MREQNDAEDTLSDPQSRDKSDDLKEGTHIDRYHILGLLGKGGMGAVYKAYDPELDRSIAIKILTAKPSEGESASRPQARLMREAQALAKLSHPNVVAVHDVGTFEDSVYIAMEYVKGMTIREWLKEQHQAPSPVGTVCRTTRHRKRHGNTDGAASTGKAGAASRKPTQKEIIKTLSIAGQGLYAAHTEGIQTS